MAAGFAQLGFGSLSLAGGTLGIIGADNQAKAEEEAAQAAALLAKEQALVESEASRRQSRQTIGFQRAQVGRSGVSLQGSQMDLLISNAFEMELEAVMIERFGAEAARQQEDRGRSIARGAQFGRAAGIVNLFGRQLAMAGSDLGPGGGG